MTSPTVKLNSGYDMPLVGFGLWKVTENPQQTVYEAIKAGYRLFDGAFDYGNEKQCGEGIKRAISEGLVKREELFIVSKLWNTFHEDHRVEPICRQQLEWWGIDYFDLYLIHFPVALKYVDIKDSYPSGWNDLDGKVSTVNAPIQETWKAMEQLVDKGLAKSIGVSNFQGSLILDLLRYARIRPATLQIEHHPYLVQKDLIWLAKSEGIQVTAYSSFGPQSFVELEWKKATDCPRLFDHDVVKTAAEKVKKTPAQVLLRWATQRGIAVIPKSNNPQRLKENMDVTGWNLDESDMEAISALDKGLRFNDPLSYLGTLAIFA
ncbi:D-xylose reductase [Ascodesmis nigricans]|uniref:D-xylose reductase n=1 Tax=Ascodesmis nigricans TaxID=341454 RepID=A0A4S2N3E5_9PEZI|nr:D-xylose reductase [Ascodesmis nigricans]